MKALVVLAVLVMSIPAIATPDGEAVVTADGDLRLVAATSAGAILVEAIADGDATIKLVATSRSNRTWPDSGLGGSGDVFNLSDGQARSFYVAGDKVDLVTIALSTANKVTVTWTVTN